MGKTKFISRFLFNTLSKYKKKRLKSSENGSKGAKLAFQIIKPLFGAAYCFFHSGLFLVILFFD
jgi:hypothetical protein